MFRLKGWLYNLGVTGIRVSLVEEEPTHLVVGHVFEGSPASRKVQVGDHIVGARGRLFEVPHRNGYGMEVFGPDGPILDFAQALEHTLGSKKRQLKLKEREKMHEQVHAARDAELRWRAARSGSKARRRAKKRWDELRRLVKEAGNHIRDVVYWCAARPARCRPAPRQCPQHQKDSLKGMPPLDSNRGGSTYKDDLEDDGRTAGGGRARRRRAGGGRATAGGRAIGNYG